MPTPTAEPGLQRLADPAAAAVAVKCQVEVNKAALGLVAGRLKSLDVCVSGIFKCIQTKPPTDAACVTKAAAKCAGEGVKLAGAEGKLGASLSAKCGAGITPAALFGAAGLDFGSLATRCVSAGEFPLDSIGQLTRCLARELACRADRLFELQQPRAAELLRRYAGSALPATCLTDQGGSGSGLGDLVVGKLVSGCATSVAKASAGFHGKALKGIGACVNKAVACVQNKPHDATCVAKAKAGCEKELGKLAAERGKLEGAIEKKCGVLDFDAALRSSQGSNLEVLDASHPDVSSLAAYETLLRGTHECAAGELMTLVAPRAGEMLGVLDPSVPPATILCSP